MRRLHQLDDFTVKQVLGEQRKNGRAIREILECLRDEGHLALSDDDLEDGVMQCDLARIANR